MREELEKKKKILRAILGDEEEDVKGDPSHSLLREFAEATKPLSKTKLWENDSSSTRIALNPDNSKAKSKNKAKPKAKASLDTVDNKRPGGDGQKLAKIHIRFEEEAVSEEEDEREYMSREEQDVPNFSESENDDLYEDLPIVDVPEGETDDKSQGKDSVPRGEATENTNKPCLPEPSKQTTGAELIAETGRLFVRNLSYSCTEEEIRRLFEPFGALAEVHLSISRETKKPKGFAYVLFTFPNDALHAYSELDGSIFQGRILHILPAQERPNPSATERDGEESSYQKKKATELKASSQKDYNWNSLFIRGDTVLDAIAAKLGIAKSSIVDVQSENLAMKLAVAETNLIHETKTYLEEEGVVLDAFKHGFERSNTLILVKNLPFDTEVGELGKIFGKFGTIGRVILPPTKAVALIEFFEVSEARLAFKSLAYSKFKHVPLFLEWAPIQALLPRNTDKGALQDGSNTNDSNNDKSSTRAGVVRIAEAAETESTLDAPVSSFGSSTSTSTLFVKNLNFGTSSDTLKTLFSTVGPVRSAKIATKKHGGQLLSLGFGFVEFERKESLNRALDELQGHVVDGHALLLKPSVSPDFQKTLTRGNRQSSATEEGKEPSGTPTKLLVRNIPFEANEKEIRELFKSFGQLKKLRVPRRFDGRHRGFCFAEFITHQEALNARNALAHTHLYGRHLVFEWAKDENSMQAEDPLQAEDQLSSLREKTRKRMDKRVKSVGGGGGGGGGNKKIRIEIDENGEDDEGESEDSSEE